jgi:hypothetical protein
LSHYLERTDLTPLRQSDGTVQLEIGSAVKMPFLTEKVADGSVKGGGFPQTSHLSEAQHCPFSSSKSPVRTLGTVV